MTNIMKKLEQEGFVSIFFFILYYFCMLCTCKNKGHIKPIALLFKVLQQKMAG